LLYLNRPFDPWGDWVALARAVGVLRDDTRHRGALKSRLARHTWRWVAAEWVCPSRSRGKQVVERRRIDERRVSHRRSADRERFADQMRAVARQAASVAWDECAHASGLTGRALAELLGRNPWRVDD
jgi:hypothetical protein